MKRKLDDSQSSDCNAESSQKRPRQTKTLTELLLEVSNGMFEDFHYHLQALKEMGHSELKLSNYFTDAHAHNFNFYNLGQAFKGTHIKSVILNNNHLGSDKIVEFVKGLKDTEVTSIELDNNDIDDEGAEKLGEALKDTMVTDISLFANNIGDLGVAKFSENLKHTKIRKLDLGFNRIGPLGANALGKGLKGSTVTSVDIAYNNIQSDGALMLIEALKETSVTKLNLETSNLSSILAIGIALEKTKITDLNLSGNNVESDIIAFLQILKDTKITKLSLRNIRPSDTSAITIVNALSDTNVTDLDLSGNNISADDIAGIGEALKNTKINKLALGNNNISTEVAEILVKSLRETEVSSLDLSFNDIGASQHELTTLWRAFIGTKISELNFNRHNNYIKNHHIGELILIIPETSLIKVEIFSVHNTIGAGYSEVKKHLTKALSLNKLKLTNKAWLLCRMWKIQANGNPDAYSAERIEAESLGTTDPKNGLSAISYCFDLPPELQDKILSYLPFMNEHLKNTNTQERHLRKRVYMDLAHNMPSSSMEP